jgi:hypothetical protein
MGIEDFRVGGNSGGWKLLFGEWAELGEGMLKLEVFACGSCGKVERVASLGSRAQAKRPSTRCGVTVT